MPKYYRDLVPFLSTSLSGTACACGTTSTVITPPTGATSAWVRAEGGAIYWNVNGASAVGTTAAGYVAQDGQATIPPLDNFSSLAIIGSAAGAVAHLEFFQD